MAERVQDLLTTGPPKATDHPDAVLHRSLTSLGGPLFAGVDYEALLKDAGDSPAPAAATPPCFGLASATFGRHPQGRSVNEADLVVAAPSMIEIRIPAALVAGQEFVVTGRLDTGRVLDYRGKPNRKMCSLFLATMDKMGVHLDRFGDSNERLAEV